MKETAPGPRPMSPSAKAAAWIWAAVVATAWLASRFRLFHGWPW